MSSTKRKNLVCEVIALSKSMKKKSEELENLVRHDKAVLSGRRATALEESPAADWSEGLA